MTNGDGLMLDPADIAEVAVYPPLGIARVGNAPGDDAFFLAAEVVGAAATSPQQLRDAQGQIRRQAVRFRIYARLHSGDMRELTMADSGVSIEWKVHVANLKAGWYEFNNAMDLPDGLAAEAMRRNRDLHGGRFRLDIAPPPKSICGRGLEGQEFVLTGKFFSQSVYLGELRTDADGRLLFLGGRGAAAPRWPGTKPTTFANNELWHDDVCDGPVRARVTVGGKCFEAAPGYVVVAPPNYAPGLFPVVTMDDVVRDLFATQGWISPSSQPSFTHDIWPIFSRLTAMQWVNHGLFMAHGFGSPLDAEDSHVTQRLADASTQNLAWRKAVFKLFRDPEVGGELGPHKLPCLYGDAYGDLPRGKTHALEQLALTPTMYRQLARWAQGDFLEDWAGPPPLPQFEQLSPAQQAENLARAPLYECLGGPFHPGIELTWIMRSPLLWAAPYRLRLLQEDEPARQDFGSILTPSQCLAADGPLRGGAPGVLTRWLGVPWQTDEASCMSDAEYAPSTYLSMPSYWGARVPNQVLSAEAWSRVADPAASPLQRLKHATRREEWTRDIQGRSYHERIDLMVQEWWMLGMLLPHDTPHELRALGLPAVSHVETGRHPSNAASQSKLQLIAEIERIGLPASERDAAGAGLPGPQESMPPRRIYHRGEV